MVKQATKYVLSILLCSAIGCAKDAPRTVPPGEPPVVRVTVYNNTRYLVIESGGRSYAVAADSNPDEPIVPCDCQLRECRPMCGLPHYDAGVEPAPDAGSRP
jgi:hypothetical protein